MTTIAIIAALVVLLAARVPVAYALGGLGVLLLLLGGFSPLIVPQGLLASTENFVLLSVPMFLLMSNILLQGGVGRDLFAAAQAWVGHWPGGLAIATVLSCGAFAAISGSSVACAATIGTVAIPEMISRGYSRQFVYGLLAAGGTLGILIPPSIPMIVFGFIAEQSIAGLFLAGIVPGLLLMLGFIAYSVVYSLSDPKLVRPASIPIRDRWGATWRAAPAVAVAVFVFGCIYSGAATPTEAAAIGFAFSLFLTTVVLRTLTWAGFKSAVMSAMTTSAAVLIIVAAAKVFGKAIALYRIPQDLSALIIAAIDQPAIFIMAVTVILLVMGCFLEALSMMILMVPVLLPALAALGIDPIWFGIYFVIMIECALITPPVGLNLYTIQSVAKARIEDVSRGVLPFVGIMVVLVAVIMLFPNIVLFLGSL